jgi:hypothetical protein
VYRDTRRYQAKLLVPRNALDICELTRFLVWHAINRICAKRLMPFLPTFIEALERHEHLHLTEERRSQLLSMSAATADRLLIPI